MCRTGSCCRLQVGFAATNREMQPQNVVCCANKLQTICLHDAAIADLQPQTCSLQQPLYFTGAKTGQFCSDKINFSATESTFTGEKTGQFCSDKIDFPATKSTFRFCRKINLQLQKRRLSALTQQVAFARNCKFLASHFVFAGRLFCSYK